MMPFHSAPPMCLERRERGKGEDGERRTRGKREERERERERMKVDKGELSHNALQCTMTEYYSIPVQKRGSMLLPRAM